MFKFSKSGWNNLIIFAVMGFILIINMTQENIFNRSEAVDEPLEKSAFLIGEHNVILSLTINQHTNIERVGAAWRTLPNVLSGQPLDAMMQAWHQAQGQVVEKPEIIAKEQAVIVSLVMAGQETQEYLMLLPVDGQLIVYKQTTNQWLSLPLPIFSQLIPNEVM